MKKLFTQLKQMNCSERKMAGTAGETAVNGMVGIYKLLLGIYYMSDWLAVNALYYLALAAAKQQLVRNYKKLIRIQKIEERQMKEQELFQKSGKFQLLLGVSYFFVNLHTLLSGDVVSYPPYIRYVMILIAFYKMSAAVMGLYRTRKSRDPVIAAVRVIDFTDAVVSLIVCRSVLQVMNHASFAVESSGIFGILCSVLFTAIGVIMLKTSAKS